MNIPAKVRILAEIQNGSVYYFEEEKLSSTEPHYFVVLNRNPRNEEFLILVCASSQIMKRKQRGMTGMIFIKNTWRNIKNY